MSDRLNQLRRQRALVQEHLAWLDAEIRASEGSDPVARPAELPHVTSTDAALDLLVAAQQSEPVNAAAAAKRGCFVAFALAFVVLGLGVVTLYLYTKSRH